jgi:hypothetical protein
MIDNIENLESMMNNEPSQVILDGLLCIHMCINIAATGNMDLINQLQNG